MPAFVMKKETTVKQAREKKEWCWCNEHEIRFNKLGEKDGYFTKVYIC